MDICECSSVNLLPLQKKAVVMPFHMEASYRHGKNKGHPAWIHILPAAVFRFRGGKTYIHHMKSPCSTANFAMNSRETRGLFALLDVPGNVDEGGSLSLTQTKWS